MPVVKVDEFREYLLDLQDRICAAAEDFEESARFHRDHLEGERKGFARPRVLSGGKVFERAAVSFSWSGGEELSPAATLTRPQLRGKAYQAVSLSMIFHPLNPHAPTSHMNLRLFVAGEGADSHWWFGGGFDLTPIYGVDADAIRWHQAARDALQPFGEQVYPEMKAACDEYFYLRHRQEPRGIGGVFYDDLNSGGFERCRDLSMAVGEAFLGTYFAIVRERSTVPYGESERRFQLERRGRYVEFNLLQDRGTLYGLQAGARVESVLASMPPTVQWAYDRKEKPGSREAELYTRYLVPRDWADMPLL
ncbi:MAG: oxygen-dependent coproporphyrinogen oxidase [Myxococcota bacterium]|nr:oxygen-dependent coproporphyrinogen oxidase [Myxococcota bacterium]